MERIIIDGNEITPIDKVEWESPYLNCKMRVNKEEFNILIIKEDKNRFIEAFNDKSCT